MPQPSSASGAVAVAVALLASVPATIGASQVEEVVAEEAQILLLPQTSEQIGASVEGYLVVWNGTTTEAQITGVRSETFRSVQLVQTQKSVTGTLLTVQQELSIPPHAELMMRPGGVYMRMEPNRPLSAGEIVELDVLFDDGSTQTLAAAVRHDKASIQGHLHDPAGRRSGSTLRGAVSLQPMSLPIR